MSNVTDRTWLAPALALGFVTFVTACSAMLSFDGFTGNAAGCPLKAWPARPSVASGGTNDGIIGATRSMKITDPSGAAIGYDLDGLCTCPDPEPCTNSRASTKTCDIGGGGVDNQAARFLTAFQLNDEGLTDGVLHGRHGIAVRIDRYNGLADDPDVIVTLYGLVGVNGKTDGSGAAKNDGTDVFTVDDSSTNGPELLPKFTTINGYVAGRVLVAPMPAFDFRFVTFQRVPGGGPDIPIPTTEALTEVRLVGRIDDARNGGLTMREALLVGRIPLTTMFARAAAGSSCSEVGSDAGASPFNQFLNLVCDQLDLPALAADDGKNKACTALSFAMKLEIGPAKLAPDTFKTGDPAPCPPIPATACK